METATQASEETQAGVTQSDDVENEPEKISELVGKCEHNLDGLKSLIKRAKVKVTESGRS